MLIMFSLKWAKFIRIMCPSKEGMLWSYSRYSFHYFLYIKLRESVFLNPLLMAPTVKTTITHYKLDDEGACLKFYNQPPPYLYGDLELDKLFNRNHQNRTISTHWHNQYCHYFVIVIYIKTEWGLLSCYHLLISAGFWSQYFLWNINKVKETDMLFSVSAQSKIYQYLQYQIWSLWNKISKMHKNFKKKKKSHKLPVHGCIQNKLNKMVIHSFTSAEFPPLYCSSRTCSDEIHNSTRTACFRSILLDWISHTLHFNIKDLNILVSFFPHLKNIK